jgi:BRCA1-associated protein
VVQGGVCHVRFVEEVHYTELIEHAHTSVTNLAEQPTCPVCLGMPSCLEQPYQLFKSN